MKADIQKKDGGYIMSYILNACLYTGVPCLVVEWLEQAADWWPVLAVAVQVEAVGAAAAAGLEVHQTSLLVFFIEKCK